MRYFLSSFAKSIVIVIVVIIIALARDRRESQRDERERKVFMRERKFYENRIQNASSHRHKKTAEYSTLLLYYRRMLFTSSATFVGAFAGVCTQMYACALRKVPLFHREYCSPFLLCLLLRHHHHHHHHHRVAALRNRLSFQSLARAFSLSLSLSFMYIKHTT